MRSDLIENPDGRFFVHSLGGGAVLVVVERGGENASLVLTTENVHALVDALSDGLNGAVVEQAPEPVPIRALPPAHTWKTIAERHAVVARLCREAPPGYWSERHGRGGKTGYLMDTLRCTYSQARNWPQLARNAGHRFP